jgi:hypothetical protein
VQPSFALENASDVLLGLWKDGYLDRVDLAPFTLSETATVLEAVLGGPVDPATTARLWQLSQR